jgi:hypothetical protein
MAEQPADSTVPNAPEGQHSTPAARARALLGQAVRENPNDPYAWYGLALACPEVERRQYCLERCLRLDPQHGEARRELEALRAPTENAQPEAEPAAQHTAHSATDAGVVQPQERPSELAQAPGVAEVAVPAEAGTSGADAAPAKLTPLAARLAAKRNALEDTLAMPEPAEERPRPAHERLAPPRVRPMLAPPPLHPVTLTQAPAGAGERVSDEEIARAALRQLLRQNTATDADNSRTSSAASIAQRYFGSTRQPARTSGLKEDDALHALGMQRRPERRTRVAVLLSALALVGLLGALLFTTLVGRI